MPALIPALKVIITGAKWLITATSWKAIAARMVFAAAISAVAAKKAAQFDPGLQARSVTTRGTIEPQKKIYGETQVSGPLAFIGTGGTNNRDLYFVVLLAGHEVDSITDIWLDSRKIENSQINGGAAGGGFVTAGTFGPVNSNNVVMVTKHLGTSTQSADSNLVNATDRDGASLGWTSNHRLRGIANIVCRFSYWDDTQQLWESGEPTNVRALVRGAKVYDPRLDSTQTSISPAGSGLHRYTDSTTWAWSDTPALCVADYLMDSKFGLGIDPTRIDWQSVADASDYCEALVNTPTGFEKRFTCNGSLFSSSPHQENLIGLLSSMNGKLLVTGGLWRVRAGYTAPTETITDDDLAAPLGIKTALDRGERFNTIRAVYNDKDLRFKPTDTPDIYTTALRDRDNGQVLLQEVNLPFTNSFNMAQRVCWQQLHVANQEVHASVATNLVGAQMQVGDRINFDVSELSWSPKVFDVLSWNISEGGGDDLGVEITIREDSASAWSDPAVGDYATRTLAGELNFGSRGTPTASAMSATGQVNGILIEWTNPDLIDQWHEVTLWSSNTLWWGSGVTVVFRGRADRFFHDLPPDTTRYYWVTYHNDVYEPSDVTEARFPDSDTSTVTATALAQQYDDLIHIPADAGSNVLRDPNFLLTNDVGFGVHWDRNNSSVMQIDATGGEDGGPCLEVNAGAATNAVVSTPYLVPARAGDVFFAKARIDYSGASGISTFRIELDEKDKDYNSVSSWPDLISAPAFPYAGWYTYDGTATVANSDTRYAEIQIVIGSAMVSGSIKVSDIEIVRIQGGLSILDTVGTGEIDADAVTDIISTQVASFTTSLLGQDVATVAVPAQDDAYTAIVIASANHWENTRNTPTGPPAWTLRLDRDGSGIVSSIVLAADGVDTTQPGTRYALQMEWDIPASTAENFNLHWSGATLGDAAEFEDIELMVIVAKR